QGTGDTYLRLYNNGVQVAANDDACGVLSQITYTASAGGTYTIREGCYSSGSCSGTVAYQISGGGPCSSVCTAGAKRCSDGLTSQNGGDWNGDGCTEWGNNDYCQNYGASYVCDAPTGYCVSPPPSCTSQCTNGAKRCIDGLTSQNCGDWNGDG